MKSIIISFLLLLSLNAIAGSVKVTSFNFVRQGQFYAELCGRVEGPTSSPSYVKIVVDPNTNNPGTYNTIAGADGKFCLVVVTYRGLADASLFGESNITKASIK